MKLTMIILCIAGVSLGAYVGQQEGEGISANEDPQNQNYYAYLSSKNLELIKSLQAAGTNISENNWECKQHDIFGYSSGKDLVVCSDNIKASGLDINSYINETFTHEALHIAQNCNKTRLIGIPAWQMKLPSNKEIDIKKSVSVFNKKSNTVLENREREAIWLENKPDQVMEYVQEICKA